VHYWDADSAPSYCRDSLVCDLPQGFSLKLIDIRRESRHTRQAFRISRKDALGLRCGISHLLRPDAVSREASEEKPRRIYDMGSSELQEVASSTTKGW